MTLGSFYDFHFFLITFLNFFALCSNSSLAVQQCKIKATTAYTKQHPDQNWTLAMGKLSNSQHRQSTTSNLHLKFRNKKQPLIATSGNHDAYLPT
jgi:hypothetical protein